MVLAKSTSDVGLVTGEPGGVSSKSGGLFLLFLIFASRVLVTLAMVKGGLRCREKKKRAGVDFLEENQGAVTNF